MSTTKNTVNIIGKGPGWQSAPVENSWGFNDHVLRRSFDVIFDMHYANRCIHTHLLPKMYERIRQAGTKIYSLEAWPNTPCSRYPIEEILSEFKTDYFTSGLDYAIALAIYEGYENIDLWGVCLKEGDEYAYQKPSAMFWLGVALGRGMTFKIRDHWSELFKHPTGKMYGYGVLIKEQEFIT